MDAKLFFDPVSEELTKALEETNNFYTNIHVFQDDLPDLEGMHIAIIGLTEDRGQFCRITWCSGDYSKEVI